MKQAIADMTKHPICAIHGTFLLILAIKSSIPTLFSGSWDAAMVDLTMAAVLLFVMFKNICKSNIQGSHSWGRLTAWGLLICSNLLILLPGNSFSGNLLRAVSFVLLLEGMILYFSNWQTALYCLPPTLWCCLFIPFHEEIMLMASYPLRLSAAMLAALVLKICGTGIVYSGTSLNLPDLNIAITDACSGINQLDAFLLIAYVTVKMMHSKANWQALHFTFIIPSVIIANALRIVLTVLLFKECGEVILGKFWHILLGYVQIVLALAIFLAIGKLFCSKPEKKQEETV